MLFLFTSKGIIHHIPTASWNYGSFYGVFAQLFKRSTEGKQNDNKSIFKKEEKKMGRCHQNKNCVGDDFNMECGLLLQEIQVFWGEGLRVHLLWHVAIESLWKMSNTLICNTTRLKIGGLWWLVHKSHLKCIHSIVKEPHRGCWICFSQTAPPSPIPPVTKGRLWKPPDL